MARIDVSTAAPPQRSIEVEVRIKRKFTTQDVSPYAGVQFRTVSVFPWDSGEPPVGSPWRRGLAIEAPEDWSCEATEALFRRAHVRMGIPAGLRPVAEAETPRWLWRRADRVAADKLGDGERRRERSAKRAFDRFAGAIGYWGWHGGYFDSEADAHAFLDEIRFMLCRRVAAPDLALWSAAGRHWAYGMAAADGECYAPDLRSGRIAEAGPGHALNRGGRPWSAAVLNLAAFHDGDAAVDAAALAHATRLWTVALDIVINMSARPARRLAARDWGMRPVTLEPTNLSGLLLASGLAYDGGAARALWSASAAVIGGAAVAASAEMAAEIGAAPAAAADPLRALGAARERRHAAHWLLRAKPGLAHAGASGVPGCGGLAEAAGEIWESAFKAVLRHGVRNARLTVTPSTRETTRLFDAGARGIGPGITPVTVMPSATGAARPVINPLVSSALRALGYHAGQIAEIDRHVVSRGRLAGAPHIAPNHIAILEGDGNRRDDDERHRSMVEAAVPFTDPETPTDEPAPPAAPPVPLPAVQPRRRGRFMVYEGGVGAAVAQ